MRTPGAFATHLGWDPVENLLTWIQTKTSLPYTIKLFDLGLFDMNATLSRSRYRCASCLWCPFTQITGQTSQPETVITLIEASEQQLSPRMIRPAMRSGNSDMDMNAGSRGYALSGGIHTSFQSTDELVESSENDRDQVMGDLTCSHANIDGHFTMLHGVPNIAIDQDTAYSIGRTPLQRTLDALLKANTAIRRRDTEERPEEIAKRQIVQVVVSSYAPQLLSSMRVEQLRNMASNALTYVYTVKLWAEYHCVLRERVGGIAESESGLLAAECFVNAVKRSNLFDTIPVSEDIHQRVINRLAGTLRQTCPEEMIDSFTRTDILTAEPAVPWSDWTIIEEGEGDA